MKTLLIILFTLINLHANELLWVDTQIEAIKPSRAAIKTSEINLLQNPFIYVKSEKEVIQEKVKAEKKTISKDDNKTLTSSLSFNPRLEAIINSSALINGKWYTIKDKIGKYTIKKINKQNVILRSKGKELLLSTQTKNENIQFKSD